MVVRQHMCELAPCDLPLGVCTNYLLNVATNKLRLHSLHSYAGSLTRQEKALLLSENISRTFSSGDSERPGSVSSARVRLSHWTNTHQTTFMSYNIHLFFRVRRTAPRARPHVWVGQGILTVWAMCCQIYLSSSRVKPPRLVDDTIPPAGWHSRRQ